MDSDIFQKRNCNARRWILVAGTGLKVGTPETDRLVAKAVGVELAKCLVEELL